MTASNYTIGFTRDEIQLESFDHAYQLTASMLSQANKSIEILCWDLTPRIYHHADIAENIKQAVLQYKVTVRILINNVDTLVKHDHLLLHLYRKLTTYIEIRKINEIYKNINRSFLAVDNAAYLLRDNAERFEGSANYNDPGKTRELLTSFNEIWEHSQPDSNLRGLHL